MLSPEEFLNSRGWHTLWSEDNWVHQSAQNPDWAGVSMEQALAFEKEKDMTALDWQLNSGKWEAVNKQLH